MIKYAQLGLLDPYYGENFKYYFSSSSGFHARANHPLQGRRDRRDQSFLRPNKYVKVSAPEKHFSKEDFMGFVVYESGQFLKKLEKGGSAFEKWFLSFRLLYFDR